MRVSREVKILEEHCPITEEKGF
eukprot:SAG31_NODE_15269_length_763_cov_0.969880_2_plen_22_part_01